MILVITGTINPAMQVRQLVLKDTEERFKQYYASISFYILQGCFRKIIFCENSNYGIEKLHPLLDLAKENNTELELFSFEGNTDQVICHGKGYGEAEIMNYVFAHSRLLEGETMFAKITGRLRVMNIERILMKIRVGSGYFNVPNHTARHMYDTRFYMMPIEQFQQYFLNTQEKVMDDKGIYLETVYTNIILENELRTQNFPVYPRITGVSASSGAPYAFVEWKSKVKDLLSKFNFYGKIKPLKG